LIIGGVTVATRSMTIDPEVVSGPGIARIVTASSTGSEPNIRLVVPVENEGDSVLSLTLRVFDGRSELDSDSGYLIAPGDREEIVFTGLSCPSIDDEYTIKAWNVSEGSYDDTYSYTPSTCEVIPGVGIGIMPAGWPHSGGDAPNISIDAKVCNEGDGELSFRLELYDGDLRIDTSSTYVLDVYGCTTLEFVFDGLSCPSSDDGFTIKVYNLNEDTYDDIKTTLPLGCGTPPLTGSLILTATDSETGLEIPANYLIHETMETGVLPLPFPGLIELYVGTYNITVTLTGYSPVDMSPIDIMPGITSSVNIAMIPTTVTCSPDGSTRCEGGIAYECIGGYWLATGEPCDEGSLLWIALIAIPIALGAGYLLTREES